MIQYSKHFATLIIVLSSFSLYSQEDEKCGGYCLIRSKYVPGYQRLPKYTGKNIDTLTNKDIYAVKFTPAEEEDRYYLKYKPDCKDSTFLCWMYCIRKISAVQEIEYFVKDTLNKNVKFEWALFPSDVEILQKEHKNIRSIICPQNVNRSIITKLEEKLKELEYYENDITGQMNKSLMRAMNSYQIDNDLAISEQEFITFELLEHLGIDLSTKTVKRRYK
jgi:hypothetical protein